MAISKRKERKNNSYRRDKTVCTMENVPMGKCGWLCHGDIASDTMAVTVGSDPLRAIRSAAALAHCVAVGLLCTVQVGCLQLTMAQWHNGTALMHAASAESLAAARLLSHPRVPLSRGEALTPLRAASTMAHGTVHNGDPGSIVHCPLSPATVLPP